MISFFKISSAFWVVVSGFDAVAELVAFCEVGLAVEAFVVVVVGG